MADKLNTGVIIKVPDDMAPGKVPSDFMRFSGIPLKYLETGHIPV